MLQTGHAVAKAVSRRLLTAETRLRSRVIPCGIYGAGMGFSPELFTENSVKRILLNAHRSTY
jgi:hypothetical protein